MNHCTIVVGYDKEGNVVAVRSFDYATEEQEAQLFLKKVIDTCTSWSIGEMKLYDISIEHKN
jgi:hypothetical protein